MPKQCQNWCAGPIAQAIPFFRYTLLGDALFATALFGGYAVSLRPPGARGKRIPRVEHNRSGEFFDGEL